MRARDWAFVLNFTHFVLCCFLAHTMNMLIDEAKEDDEEENENTNDARKIMLRFNVVLRIHGFVPSKCFSSSWPFSRLRLCFSTWVRNINTARQNWWCCDCTLSFSSYRFPFSPFRILMLENWIFSCRASNLSSNERNTDAPDSESNRWFLYLTFMLILFPSLSLSRARALCFI